MYSEINFDETCLKDYRPFPKASEREGYAALPEEAKETVIKHAEEYLGFSFYGIPATVFLEYSRIGNRIDFEEMNFKKRHALNALVMGECVEHKGRFLDDIINGIYSLCEESAWQLPAHNSYNRGGPNYPLPDVTDPVIDLFAAETGALLACISYLLGAELDAVSPFIRRMIADNLRRRIYEPYMGRHFWWMGNGDEPMCNWTVWCTQNILLAVFLMDEELISGTCDDGIDDPAGIAAAIREFKARVIKKACGSIDCFLKDYGEDGCCDEGPHYYRRSALCMMNATSILNAVTNGAFEKVLSENKIRNIVSYIFNVNASGRYYFNFADCSAVLDRSGAGEFLAAKATDNKAMMGYAAKDHRLSLSENLPKNEEEINLFLRMQELFTEGEMLSYDTKNSEAMGQTDCFYESVGLFIARDPHFALAVKAGDNDDSHNHNDTGSLILYKDGRPVLIDAGVETYSAKTFSKDRYSIWTMQSSYHNLPEINGVMQSAGAKYRAEDVNYSFSEKEAVISMDIAKAYPEEAGIASYRRRIVLTRGEQGCNGNGTSGGGISGINGNCNTGGKTESLPGPAGRITVSDHAEFADPERQNGFCLYLMLCEQPELTGNTIKLPGASIEFAGEVRLSYEVIPVTDARLKWAWNGNIYRVKADIPGDTVTFTIV